MDEVKSNGSKMKVSVKKKQPPVFPVSIVIPDTESFDHIIHLSDIHIPIGLHVSRRDEYLTVFTNLYNYLSSLNLERSLIVITGDLVNTKLKTENETLVMAQTFLTRLSELTHTLVMVGNHDFAENNTDRLDSITAICHALPKVHVLRDTGIYLAGNCTFVFSSLLDHQFIHHSSVPIEYRASPRKTIALYHGSLVGSKMDNGTPVTSHRTKFYPSISDFDGFDAVLLGHIHLRQFARPHIAYAGSLIQQKISESPTEHGLIVWDINRCRGNPINIDNPYMQLVIDITDGIISWASETLLKTFADRKFTLRLDYKSTSPTQLQQIKDTLCGKYTIVKLTTRDLTKHQYTGPNQESKMDKYATSSDYDLIIELSKSDLVDHIVKMHTEFSSLSETKSNSIIQWKPLRMEFSNLFIYGKNHINTVSFTDGVINLCSPNATGKSSLVNILLLALFPKDKCDILHKGATNGYVSLDLIANGKPYNVTRKFESKGGKLACRTSFSSEGTNLNGTSETATYKLIQDLVGTRDQFLSNNTICNRLSFTSVLAMTPGDLTKHMQYVFGLTHYDTCYNMANDQWKTVKKEVEKLENTVEHLIKRIDPSWDMDYINHITHELENSIADTQSSIKVQQDIRDKYMMLLGTASVKLRDLQKAVKYEGCLDELIVELEQVQEEHSELPPTVLDRVSNYSLTAIQQQISSLDSKLRSGHSLQISIEGMDVSNRNSEWLRTRQAELKVEETRLNRIIKEEKLPSSVNIEHQEHQDRQEYLDDMISQLNSARLSITSDLSIEQLKTMCQVLDPDDDIIILKSERSELELKSRQLSDAIKTLTNKVRPAGCTPKAYQKEMVLLPLLDKRHVDMSLVDKLRESVSLDQEQDQDQENIEVFVINDEEWVRYADHLKFAEIDYRREQRRQLKQFEDDIEHNTHCDAIASHNQAVIIIQERQALVNTKNIAKETSERLNTVNHKIQALELRDQIEAKILVSSLKNQLAAYVSYQLPRIKKELSAITNYLTHINKLEAIGDLREIKTHRDEWADCERASRIVTRLNDLANSRDVLAHLPIIESEVCNYKGLLSDVNTRIEALTQEHLSQNGKLHELHTAKKDMLQLIDTRKQLEKLHEKNIIYAEYVRLFGKNGIPAVMLERRLEQLSEIVNTIFFKYTNKYHFKCVLDRSETRGTHTIKLIIENTQHETLDFNRLSGYETVLLNIALNKGLTDLDSQYKAGIFIIDESLDCIDQERFQTCLPDIFELLKQSYSSILVISHRDVPAQLVDRNLDIISYGAYSRIQ
jgi:DNA repair exonuclease SbcCD ATPase subunit